MSEYDEFDDERDEEEVDNSGPGFTVAMRGSPNMATVQWCGSAAAAIKKTAREWRCDESALYIYKGYDE